MKLGKKSWTAEEIWNRKISLLLGHTWQQALWGVNGCDFWRTKNGGDWIMVTCPNRPLCSTPLKVSCVLNGSRQRTKWNFPQFCLPFLFFALSQGSAAPLGCRWSYLKPVMTPLYPSEWLICSLKERRWASLIGTWIFLKDVTGSGIGNITHNIK